MRTQWQEEIRKQQDKERLARRILGVSEDADAMAIKKAFWLLAMRYHPDRHPRDRESRKTFQNIVNAYEFLTKGKARGWDPADEDGPAGEERIGEYLANDWGYFCWWRDNFGEGNNELRTRKMRKTKQQIQPDSKPGDWW
jgi:DnaJ-class molecular chaperone